jgi:hypothetical protein
MGWLVALSVFSLILHILNGNSTVAHPVGRITTAIGLLVSLLAVVAVHCGFSYGHRHFSTKFTSSLTLVGLVGVLFRWVPLVVPLMFALGCCIILVALWSAERRREVVAVVLTLLASVGAFLIVTAASEMLVRCNVQHRWVCDLENTGLFGLLVATIFMLHSALRREAGTPDPSRYPSY